MVDLDLRASSEGGLASLEQHAYTRIKDAIIVLTLPPGAPIVETQIAEQIGVSKTPIRAALLQLEREGFVVSVPYRGSRSAPVTLHAIKQLYQLREAVETYAVREAVKTFVADDFEAVERLLRLQQEAFESGEYEATYLLDDQFHSYFVERLENPHLTRISRNLSDHRRRLRHILANSRLDNSALVAHRHRAVLDAVYRRDVTAAEAAVLENILTALLRAEAAEQAGLLSRGQLEGAAALG